MFPATCEQQPDKLCEHAQTKKKSNTMEEMSLVSWVVWRISLIIISIATIGSFVDTISLRKASERHCKDIKLRRVVSRISLIISSVAIRSYVKQLRSCECCP